ncbi:MAG: DegV family protein [Sulfurifustis sp.]
MNIGLMTDAACDLPSQFLQQHNVEVLPINLRFGERSVLDIRDVNLTLEFYRSYMGNKDLEAETSPLTIEETANFFRTLAPRYDKIICLVVAATRSKIFENAANAAQAVGQELREARQAVNAAPVPNEQFGVRVIDTDSLFTGQGVLVYAALRALQEGMSYSGLVSYIQEMVPKIHGYLVPQDLYYIRRRGRKRGDKSVSLMRYLVGNALDIKPIVEANRTQSQVAGKGRGFEETVQKVFNWASADIEAGLKLPAVVMSYGGNPKEITDTDAYKRFAEIAKPRGIKLLLSVMSPTAGIYVGPRSFSLAYAMDGYDNAFIRRAEE